MMLRLVQMCRMKFSFGPAVTDGRTDITAKQKEMIFTKNAEALLGW